MLVKIVILFVLRHDGSPYKRHEFLSLRSSALAFRISDNIPGDGRKFLAGSISLSQGESSGRVRYDQRYRAIWAASEFGATSAPLHSTLVIPHIPKFHTKGGAMSHLLCYHYDLIYAAKISQFFL